MQAPKLTGAFFYFMALRKNQFAAIDAINEAINTSIDEFEGVLPLLQKRLVIQLKRALTALKLTSEGLIKPTTENIQLIQTIMDDLRGGLITRQYIKALDKYLATFNPILELNNKYFGLLVVNYIPSKTRFAELSKQVIDLTKFTMGQSGVWNNVMNDIQTLLTSNAASGGSYSDMLRTLTSQVRGTPQVNGYVEKYAKQLVTDSVMQYNRQMQSTIAADLKLEWYYYQGTVIKDSRPFCVERHGNYYHQKEVESWVNQKWQGKIQATNENSIFTYAGGYNCRHSIIPVSQTVVPAADILRAKNLKYF